MIRFLLISYLLLSVTFNPWQITVFLSIKNFLLQFFLILPAIFLLTKKSILFPLSYLYYLVLVFGFWTILHLRIFSLRDSYFFLLLLPILPLIVSNIKKRDIDKIFYWVVILGTFLSLYGIFQYFGVDFSFWHGNVNRNRVFGLFGNVNYFAIYLIPSFCLSFFYFLKKEGISKILFFVIFLFNFLAVAFTFTRSVYLGLFISLIYIILKDKNNKKTWLWSILFILFAIFLIYKLGYIDQIVERIALGMRHVGSVKRRFFLWRVGISMVNIKTLLWGRGLGFYGYMFPYYQGVYVEFFKVRPYSSSVSLYAHNEYLQFLIELGLMGVLIFIGIIYLFFRKVPEKNNSYAVISGSIIIAYFVVSLFSFPLHLSFSAFLFWFFVSIPLIFERKKIVYVPFFTKFLSICILIILLFFFTNLYLSHSYAFYKDYKEVKVLNPFWGEMRMHLGIKYLRQGNVDMGLSELIEAKKTYNDFLIYYNLGILYFKEGKYKEAKEMFRYARPMAKNRADRANIFKFLGIIYSIYKNEKKAYDMLSLSLSLNPKDPEIYYNLAILDKKLGKKEECKKLLREGLKYVANSSKLKNIMLKILKNCKR